MSDADLPHKSNRLPIAVDAMGGDNGPEVVVSGAVQAARELGIASIIVGREPELRDALRENDAENEELIQICHAPEVVSMDDSPSVAVRRKGSSSISVGFELVQQQKASGLVSPGNTGAVMAAGLFALGTLPGIVRPAIASLIPRVDSAPPTVLLDSGANTDCHAHQLVQFALMGHHYARSVTSRERPRVALLSNGSEPSKGNDITRSTAIMLEELEAINYVGYVEGRDICGDIADVVVCDGFVGNIVLKTMEGSVGLVVDSMKNHVAKNPRGKFGLWFAKPMFRQLFQEKLDPSSYGGAPLLGLRANTIICHGSSNNRAIYNAIRVAKKFADEGLIERLGLALSSLDSSLPGSYEDGVWDRMGQRFTKKKEKKKAPHPEDLQPVEREREES